MIFNIKHQTNYYFTDNVPRLVQSLKLYPSKCNSQNVLNWKITCDNSIIEASHQDALGHQIYNIYTDNFSGEQIIISEGKIETKNCQGIMKGLHEKVNPICFLRNTELTMPGKKIWELSKKLKKKKDEISFCHELNLIVAEIMSFKTGSTNNGTTAETSLKQKKGVCQDYAHIMISLARIFDIPARYINGYLMESNNSNSYSTHAWVEVFIKNLGWVGFDPSHKKCIDENYIRISCGYDFTDASPIKGVKLNFSGIENLSFKLDINSVQ